METKKVDKVEIDMEKVKKVSDLVYELCETNLEVVLILEYVKFMFERSEIINMKGQGHLVPQQDNDYIK